MRRKDRQVTELSEIMAIVARCPVCRLGMVDGDGQPYVVPMNFGYTFDGPTLTLVFHGAREGRKIDVLRQNPQVCFEMDGGELITGTKGCSYSYKYESVIGNGRAVFIIEEQEEKAQALSVLMAHYAPAKEFTFTPGEMAAVAVFKVTSEDYTAKRN